MAREKEHIKGQWTPGREARQSARNSIKEALGYLNRNKQPAQPLNMPQLKGQWTPGREARQSARSSIEKTLKYLNRNKQPAQQAAPGEQIIGTSPQPYDIAEDYKKFLAERAPVTPPYKRGHDPQKDISIIPEDESPEIVEIKENKEQRVFDKVEDTTNKILDKEIQKSEATGEPVRNLGSVWEEALITLGPALAGILEPGLQTGKIGLEAQKHYLKRKDYEQDRIDQLKLAKARQKGLAGYSTKPYYDPKTNTTKWGKVHRDTGEFLKSPDDPIVGYAPKYVKDALGRQVRVHPSDPGSIVETKIGQYEPKLQVGLDDARKSLTTGPLKKSWDGMTKRYDEAQAAKELLTAGQLIGTKDGKAKYEYNQIAGEAAKTAIARMSGEVGALSNFDIQRFGGDKAIASIAERVFFRVTEGQPLLIKDRRNLLQIVDIYEKVTAEKTQGFIKKNAQSFINQYKDSGLKAKDFYEVLNPYGYVDYGPTKLPHEKLGVEGVAKISKDKTDVVPAQSKPQMVSPMESQGEVLMIPPGDSDEVELEYVDQNDINYYLNKGYLIHKGVE